MSAKLSRVSPAVASDFAKKLRASRTGGVIIRASSASDSSSVSSDNSADFSRNSIESDPDFSRKISQEDLEIPFGKRALKYRFFEILPAFLSVGAIVLLIALSFFAPVFAALFVLVLVIMTFVRAFGVAYRTIQGNVVRHKFAKLDYGKMLDDLRTPAKVFAKMSADFAKNPKLARKFFANDHFANLENISKHSADFPEVDDIYHGIVIPLYNESFDILKPTLDAVLANNFNPKKIFITLGYEARGGAAARETVSEAKKAFGAKFGGFFVVEHPADLPNEIVGKGPNITFAARVFAKFIAGEEVQGQTVVKVLRENSRKSDKLFAKTLDPKNVIITTLDCDNRPSAQFFANLTYEFITRENRQQVAFQPICLFNNNIWDVPAPIRVVATGNSFFNIIGSMRPHTLRNFASHSQGLWALEQMDFWSVRTVVEDGHQFWRSYFTFDGDYEVVPFFSTVGQDAVYTGSYRGSLKAQFVQLRRWAYGASDVPYVANLGFSRKFHHKLDIFAKFFRLLEGHVSLASVAPIVALGAFAPLYLNPSAAHSSIVVNDLPLIVARIQQIAILGLMITVFSSVFLLPKRPKTYRRSRNILMIVQWVLMPITAIVYWSAAAYTAQIRLATGHYMGKFDLTEKKIANPKPAKKARK
jgi:cellulose synthase/poly-beta-1,6-N-acetylglucosamine synthase-like glycosyltransferase